MSDFPIDQIMSIYFYGKVNAIYFITSFVFKGTDLGDYCSIIAISGLAWRLDKPVRTLKYFLEGLQVKGKTVVSTFQKNKEWIGGLAR